MIGIEYICVRAGENASFAVYGDYIEAGSVSGIASTTWEQVSQAVARAIDIMANLKPVPDLDENQHLHIAEQTLLTLAEQISEQYAQTNKISTPAIQALEREEEAARLQYLRYSGKVDFSDSDEQKSQAIAANLNVLDRAIEQRTMQAGAFVEPKTGLLKERRRTLAPRRWSTNQQ